MRSSFLFSREWNSLNLTLQSLLLLIRCVCICGLPHQDELFFIYNWPDLFKIVHNDIRYRNNFGLGTQFNAINGSHDTLQFDLFPLFYYRALHDPRRTLDPEKASSFFIPYDFYGDTLTYRGANNVEHFSWNQELGANEMAPLVAERLLSSKYFIRNGGNDHFLIESFVAIESRIHRPLLRPLLRGCANCTKLTIEELTFLAEKGQANNEWHALRGPNWLVF